jgi:N-acyl-D-amino-acid deacylase
MRVVESFGDSKMAYDIVIKGAAVLDGTGRSGVEADVAISGGVIAEIGQVSPGRARIIDARGLMVAPGFIDMHSHTDHTLPVDPRGDDLDVCAAAQMAKPHR